MILSPIIFIFTFQPFVCFSYYIYVLYYNYIGLFDQALYHSKEGLRTIDALTPDDKNLPKTMHINASALCIAGEVLIHQGLYPLPHCHKVRNP